MPITPFGAVLLAAYNHGFHHAIREDESDLSPQSRADWFYWHCADSRESFLMGYEVGLASYFGEESKSIEIAARAEMWRMHKEK